VIQRVAKKAFEDRHILVDDAVLNYLSTHLTRSFPLVHKVVARADQKSLSTGRKITIPILKQVMDEINEEQAL
jgi:chromosomal replication initiation ATPase DnaA